MVRLSFFYGLSQFNDTSLTHQNGAGIRYLLGFPLHSLLGNSIYLMQGFSIKFEFGKKNQTKRGLQTFDIT